MEFHRAFLEKLAYILLCVRWTHCDSVTLGLLIPLTGADPIGQRSAGAIKVALDNINGDEAFTELKSRNLTLDFVMVDTACSAGVGLINMVKIQDQVNAYIGGYCDSLCAPASMVAEQMSKPIISYGCASIELSDKQRFPTFARTVSPHGKAAPVLVALLRHYNWTRLAIIYGSDHVWHLASASVSNEFAHTFEEGQIISTQQIAIEEGSPSVTPETALRRTRDISRVFVVLANPTLVKLFMEASYKLGMQNGEYVFISVESDLAAMTGTVPVSGGGSGDHSRHFSRKRRDATRSRFKRDFTMTAMGMMGNMTLDDVDGNKSGMGNMMSSDMPMHDAGHNQSDNLIGLIDISATDAGDSHEYKSFASQVRLALMIPPFSSHLSSPDQVSLFTSVYLHDAVYLYAVALNRTLSHNMNLTHVIRNIFNIEFQGCVGPVVIDTFGDPLQRYSIRNYQNKRYVTVASYQPRMKRIHFETDKRVVWPGGSTEVPIGRPRCGWDGELCIDSEIPYIIWPCLALGFVVVICLLVYSICRNKQRQSKLASMQWKIKYEEIKFLPLVASSLSLGSITTQSSRSSRHDYASSEGWQAIVRGNLVYIKSVNKSHVHVTKIVITEMNETRALSHQNINQLIGACVEVDRVCLISTHCPKASLQDVLANETIKLDNTFKISFASDIAQGMEYLHKSTVAIHGRLRSNNILIDNRWQCKLSNYGLWQFRAGETDYLNGEIAQMQKLLWTAPEHLRSLPAGRSQKGDVYSFAIILHEIVQQTDGPFGEIMLDAHVILQKLRDGSDPPFRPKVSPETCISKLLDLIKACWDEIPEERPNFKSIIRCIRATTPDRQYNLVDNMMRMMESYATRLEEIIEERSKKLLQEQKHTENLLSRMLPKFVAEELKAGRTVTPEYFDQVTIYFSDIVGFTALSSDSTPMQVVNFLNDLYTVFDTIIESYDVYKVETIGDAYMVVSGLPLPNGLRHAGEIATMALDLLAAIGSFQIRHRPGTQLKLRIGLHTGSCVAAVVGLKMPRYCLFGDTVNYASRMESTGIPLKIHISPECKALLETLGGYHFQRRGEVAIKGKGSIMTYFLEMKDGFDKPLPTRDNDMCT